MDLSIEDGNQYCGKKLVPVTRQVVADEYYHPVEDDRPETHGSPPSHPSPASPRTTRGTIQMSVSSFGR